MSNPARKMSDFELVNELSGKSIWAFSICKEIQSVPGGNALLATMYDNLPFLREQEIEKLFQECEKNYVKFLNRVIELCEQ